MATRAAIFGCAGTALTADEARFFGDAQPWGFILFARNVENPAQVTRLVTDLRAAVGWQAPVLIDQEGGRVQRLRAPHWREWAPPLDLLAGLDDAAGARAMFLRGRLIGAELSALGIDVNCAPVADIARHDTHPVLRNRCLGQNAGRVAAMARAMADGLLAGGVLPVIKHMPGHGAARVDSHLDLPRIDDGLDPLRLNDFAPFRSLADLPLGMSAHIVVSAIDPHRPATQSPAVLRMIRDDIGFDGLLMSDDIAMQALSGSIGQRSHLALAAGIDMILHCNGKRGEMEEVLSEAPLLSGAALDRANRALALRQTPQDIDAEQAMAELAAMGDAHV